MSKLRVIVLAAGAVSIGSAGFARAQTSTFQVDQTASTLTIGGEIQGATVFEQGPGSLSTTYTGPLRLQLTEDSIAFVGGSSVEANNNGTWQPAPGGVAGSAPANYGGQFELLFTIGNLAVRDAAFDVSTASPFALNFNGGGNTGTFAAGVTLTAISGSVDYNHPIAVGTTELSGNVNDNASTDPASLTIAQGTGGDASASLQIPVDMTIMDVSGTFTFTGSLTARATARPGDANFDGVVNLTDFNTLAANFGASSGQNWLSGDFTFDGLVNLADFNLLAANFGTSAGAGGPTSDDWNALASAIPEPGTLGVISSLAAIILLRRRRAAGSLP